MNTVTDAGERLAAAQRSGRVVIGGTRQAVSFPYIAASQIESGRRRGNFPAAPESGDSSPAQGTDC